MAELIILRISLVLHRRVVRLVHDGFKVLVLILFTPLAHTLVCLVIKVKLGKVVLLNVRELFAVLGSLHLRHQVDGKASIASAAAAGWRGTGTPSYGLHFPIIRF